MRSAIGLWKKAMLAMAAAAAAARLASGVIPCAECHPKEVAGFLGLGDALGLELPVIEGVSAMNRIIAELASDRSDLVGDAAEEVGSDTTPDVVWISAAEGTRAPPFLEDRAAKYLFEKNLLQINADFRVFMDMEERWCNFYSAMSGAKPTRLTPSRAASRRATRPARTR